MSKETEPSISDLVISVKESLSDSAHRIPLDDVVVAEIRSACQRLEPEHFPLDNQRFDGNTIQARLREYESSVARILTTVTLVARWGGVEHRATLGRFIPRLTDPLVSRIGGNAGWIALQWYPLSLIQYAGGIAALSADQYENLATLLIAPTVREASSGLPIMPVHYVIDGLADADRYEAFKKLPAHERHRVPRSEYMFNVIRPLMEEQLYLGDSYEGYFDRFEVLLALAYADKVYKDPDHAWGPLGRFGWKRERGGRDPFGVVLEEASVMGDGWPPLAAGFFNGTIERFQKIAESFQQSVFQRLR